MIAIMEKGIRRITTILCYAGMVMLSVLMFLGATDVVTRYFFNMPIKGAYEYSEILLAGAVFFGLAYTLSVGGHVSIDTFSSRFRPLIKALIAPFISLLSLCLFALIGWQGAVKALNSWEVERVIDVIQLPIAPFQLFVTVGAVAVCLELILQFFKDLWALKEEV